MSKKPVLLFSIPQSSIFLKEKFEKVGIRVDNQGSIPFSTIKYTKNLVIIDDGIKHPINDDFFPNNIPSAYTEGRIFLVDEICFEGLVTGLISVYDINDS